MEEYYYDKPFQVIFLRENGGIPTYEKGIVFQDFIIAARDGEVFSLNETIANAARIYGIKADYAVIEGIEWVPIEIE